MFKRKTTVLWITIVTAIAAMMLMPVPGMGGSLEPTAVPAPTMRTLDEIYSASSWSKKLPASERFVVLADFNNEAVLDKETGLVWEKSPSTIVTYQWVDAITHCAKLDVGGRKGWHLPTVEQLASLVDQTQADPALPSGHPFLNVAPSAGYWSATTVASDSSSVWAVGFHLGGVGSFLKNSNDLSWCVRGGQSHDAY